MKLIIQIPCFNEQNTLITTLDDLPKELDGFDKIEYLIGILGDTITANRKILQDTQYHTRKMYYDGVKQADIHEHEKCRIYYR